MNNNGKVEMIVAAIMTPLNRLFFRFRRAICFSISLFESCLFIQSFFLIINKKFIWHQSVKRLIICLPIMLITVATTNKNKPISIKADVYNFPVASENSLAITLAIVFPGLKI